MGIIINPALASPMSQFGDVLLDQTGVPSTVTGTTDATVLRAVYVPPPLLGTNSRIEIRPVWSYSNSADDKTFGVKAGATFGSAATIYSRTRTTSSGEMPLIAVQFRGSLTTQLTPYSPLSSYSYSTTAASVINIDFSPGIYLFFFGQLEVPADQITLDGVQIKIVGPGRA